MTVIKNNEIKERVKKQIKNKEVQKQALFQHILENEMRREIKNWKAAQYTKTVKGKELEKVINQFKSLKMNKKFIEEVKILTLPFWCKSEPGKANIHHLVPKSFGGKNNSFNCVLIPAEIHSFIHSDKNFLKIDTIDKTYKLINIYNEVLAVFRPEITEFDKLDCIAYFTTNRLKEKTEKKEKLENLRKTVNADIRQNGRLTPRTIFQLTQYFNKNKHGQLKNQGVQTLFNVEGLEMYRVDNCQVIKYQGDTVSRNYNI